MGSFEEWDKLIRACCIWAGLADPLLGRERIRAEGDADLDALRGVVAEWARVYMDQPVTAADVVERAKTDDAFRSALEVFADASAKHPLSARSLGYALRGGKRRVVEGVRLEPDGESGGSAKWKLVRATPRHNATVGSASGADL